MACTPVVIGISGGSSAGKTTFTDRLAQKLVDLSPTVLNQDRYFRNWSALPEAEREIARTANHPRAVLWEPLIAHVESLSRGEPIEVPPPGTRAFDQGNKSETVSPGELVIVEGHLIFGQEALRALFELKIFLDVDTHERVLRRMLRDTANNRSLDEVVAWYRRDVIPNFAVHTEPTRQYADLIVPFEGEVDTAIEVVANGVRGLVASKSQA